MNLLLRFKSFNESTQDEFGKHNKNKKHKQNLLVTDSIFTH